MPIDQVQTNSASDIRNLHTRLHTSSPLARDECGDWSIFGSKGKFYGDGTHGPSWYVYIDHSWLRAKRGLSFMEVHQDGEAEGVLKLERLPTPEEACLIRKWAGLGTRKTLTPERRAKLIEVGRKFRFSHGAQPTKSAQIFIQFDCR
jgi:hypothetical protein